MNTVTVRLSDRVREILLRAKTEGNRLTLSEQLSRDDYVAVNKAIAAAGGVWSRKKRCHLFPGEVRKTLNITQDTTDVINVKQTHQAFYTPADVAERLVGSVGVCAGLRVLEPSAGEGALVKAVWESVGGAPETHVVAVEKRPESCEVLYKMRNSTPGANIANFQVMCGDFLEQEPSSIGLFDRIVMNPPFTRGEDIRHIKHAWRFLKPSGQLAAVCANGARQNNELRSIAASWEDVEAGAFASSGTNVRTAIMVITGGPK